MPALRDCIQSLLAQSLTDFEIVVVDSTPDDDSACEIAGDARIRVHRHPSRLGAHAARNLAAGMATGDYLAFIDPDMTAAPDWLEVLSSEHDAGHTVVGGGVDCEPGYWTTAVHLTKYGWWLSGGSGRVRSQLPSGSLSLPRELFLKLGGFPARYWEGDTELSYKLRDAGHALWHQPAAVSTHFDNPSWRQFLTERYTRGVDTAKARSHRHRGPAWLLPLRAIAAPIAWVLMVARTFYFAAQSGWTARWFPASPVIAIGLAAWIAGEALTYMRYGILVAWNAARSPSSSSV